MKGSDAQGFYQGKCPKREEDGEEVGNLGSAFIPCRWTPSEGERERSLCRSILRGLGRCGKAAGSP